jgi:hypothetical protein
MSDADGTEPSTQVPVVRCALVPATMSYRARQLMSLLLKDPASVTLLGIERLLSVTAGDPGMYRARSHRGSTVDRQVMKFCLFVAIETGGRTGTDHFWV